MKAATRMTCNRFIVALVVAAAVDVVHRPAVTTYCHAGRRCRGGRGQEDKRCWADKTCAKADNPFDAPRAAHVRPAAAPGNPVAYRTHAQGRNQNIIGVNLGYLCRVRLKFNVKLK